VWKTPLARQAQPAVSPCRRQIAVSDENGIAILNAETGDLIATIPTVEGEGKLAFSPDGDRIAVVNRSGSLCVFDIANGDLLHRMGADATKAPQWAGPQHILVGDQLYSLRHSLKLWR